MTPRHHPVHDAPVAHPCDGLWFRRSPAVGRPRLTLICLPHAGGGAGVFRQWRNGLPADVEIWAVRLPGRDARFDEPAFDRMEPLVEAVSDSIARCIDGPFVMFGHSMGALAAFEVSRMLVGRGCEPSGLVVSGSRAPQQRRQPPYLHDLPHHAFIAALTDLGGTPPEILASPELFDLLEPTLRADFRAVETYTCADLTPMDVPITAFGGRRDTRAPPAAIERWREVAGCRFTSVLIDGGHFFLNEREDAFLTELRKILDAVR